MNRKFLKVVVGLLGHVTPAIFFRRILRSEALVYTSVFFSEQPFYGNYSTLDSHLVKMASKAVKRSIQLFLGVAEFKCFLLVCDVVWSLFSIFSFFCITSFGDCTRLQHQETTTVRLLACILTNLKEGRVKI